MCWSSRQKEKKKCRLAHVLNSAAQVRMWVRMGCTIILSFMGLSHYVQRLLSNCLRCCALRPIMPCGSPNWMISSLTKKRVVLSCLSLSGICMKTMTSSLSKFSDPVGDSPVNGLRIKLLYPHQFIHSRKRNNYYSFRTKPAPPHIKPAQICQLIMK